MKVAICIVGYRNPDDILRCLAALDAGAYPDVEVVVCENGGAEPHAALEAALAAGPPRPYRVRALLAPGNLGFAGGVNRCIAEAPDADAWWVLNPDTVPEPQALAALVARLAVGDCEAVGGPVLLADGVLQSYGGHWQTWIARAVSLGYGGDPRRVPAQAEVERAQNYLNGASMLIGRAFVEKVGLMREDYFLYSEEVEWCLRARRAGLRLGYAPEGRVLHFQGSSTGHSASLRDRSALSVHLNERNRLLLTRDLFGARLPVVAVLALLQLTQRYGRARAWRQLGHAAAGWLAGLRNVRGPYVA